ncbi:hypothetical protein [Nocardia sp. NPDC003345]
MTDDQYLTVIGDFTYHLVKILERAAEIGNTRGYNYLAVEHVALAMLEDSRWYGTEDWDRPLAAGEWRQKLIDGLPPLPARSHRSDQAVAIDYRLPDFLPVTPDPCPFIQEFEFPIFATADELTEFTEFVTEFVRDRSRSVADLHWQIRSDQGARHGHRLEKRWRDAHPGSDAGTRRPLTVFVGLYLVDSVVRDRLLNDLCGALPASDATWTATMNVPESAEQARALDLGSKYPELSHLESL